MTVCRRTLQGYMNMRKERPRILDRDSLTHKMDESTDTTKRHMRPKCGTKRSRNAVSGTALTAEKVRRRTPACRSLA